MRENIAIEVQRLLIETYGLMNTLTVHEDGLTVVTAQTDDGRKVRVIVQVLEK